MARPTKYKPEYCGKIIEYFSVEPTQVVATEYTNKKGETWSKNELAANKLPFISNFAAEIGVANSTLFEWKNKFKEFSTAYARAKELQKAHLIECGLLGLFNCKFTIFTAKNITDMRDKTETEISGAISFTEALSKATKGEQNG